MDNKNISKRLSHDKNYQRPSKTYQDTLTNQEIKEKLKDYKKVTDVRNVNIGSHLRYFSIDPKTNEKQFRLGGTLNKIDPEGRFVVLSNGAITWSVQILNTTFFQKMTENEFKEELKKELKKELANSMSDDENELKKEVKLLNNKIDQYKIMEKEFKSLIKKNETLSNQISKIEQEIKKNKNKK
jgi:hypothetical protein